MNIIEMAREAGFKGPTPADGYMGTAYDRRDGTDSGGSLERFAALVRDAALEEAARTAEQYCGAWDDEGHTLAAAIRSLKERQ